MLTSRVLRNVGMSGNRLMNEPGSRERTMWYGAGALAGLTALVYYAGYRAEGTAGRDRASPNFGRDASENSLRNPKVDRDRRL
ncbi:hypothetical protein B0H34DRAFT_860088 [Crassisporium funariophilum]|nr:hypothetical protein B0H34DRAFT_860088 [Crassisporium funariophilum]